jgi:hypothetical protein
LSPLSFEFGFFVGLEPGLFRSAINFRFVLIPRQPPPTEKQRQDGQQNQQRAEAETHSHRFTV